MCPDNVIIDVVISFTAMCLHQITNPHYRIRAQTRNKISEAEHIMNHRISESDHRTDIHSLSARDDRTTLIHY